MAVSKQCSKTTLGKTDLLFTGTLSVICTRTLDSKVLNLFSYTDNLINKQH